MSLLKEVRTGLARHKGDWPRIAEAVPEVSYSWLAKVGGGNYASSPIHTKLEAVAKWLRRNRKHGRSVRNRTQRANP